MYRACAKYLTTHPLSADHPIASFNIWAFTYRGSQGTRPPSQAKALSISLAGSIAEQRPRYNIVWPIYLFTHHERLANSDC